MICESVPVYCVPLGLVGIPCESKLSILPKIENGLATNRTLRTLHMGLGFKLDQRWTNQLFFWALFCPSCEPAGHTMLKRAGVPFSYLFVILLAGYRPILDAMKTFAKSSDPIDIEVYNVILFVV